MTALCRKHPHARPTCGGCHADTKARADKLAQRVQSGRWQVTPGLAARVVELDAKDWELLDEALSPHGGAAGFLAEVAKRARGAKK